MTAPTITKSAVISDCGIYRYQLTRRWDATRPDCVFICLNPSIADADRADPTLRKMMWFADRDGFGGVQVLNLFALRSSKPEAIGRHMDPVGPDNADYLSTALASDLTVICGWGAHKDARARGANLKLSARSIDKTLWCLGTNSDGSPHHPCYLPYTTRLEIWL